MEGRHTTRSLRPEIGRFWIRRTLREWPGSERRWVDLAEGAMRQVGSAGSIPDSAAIESDGGLLYMPPADAAQVAARDALVGAFVERRVPLLVQVIAGDRLAASPPPEIVAVDVTEVLLERRLPALDETPAGSVVVWPLIAGLTDDEAMWDDGCRRLRAARVDCVQAVVLDLSPAQRRELAGDLPEGAAFSRIFHGRAADERRFAQVAAAHGLEVFLRRRGTGADRKARNAALAELLALGGELWLRLGRGEVQGQELFRASRWVEDAAVDVRALATERNLDIVEALRTTLAAAIVGEWAREGASSTVDGWLAEYTGATATR